MMQIISNGLRKYVITVIWGHKTMVEEKVGKNKFFFLSILLY